MNGGLIGLIKPLDRKDKMKSKLHIAKQLRLGKAGDVFYIAADSERIWVDAYRIKGLKISQLGLKAVYVTPTDSTVRRLTEVTIIKPADPPEKRKGHTCSICGEVGHYKSTCNLFTATELKVE